MSLTFKITSEAIRAQHLKRTEEHEQSQPLHEITHRRNFDIVFQRIIIYSHKLTSQFMGIPCGRLPKERSKVIVVRTFASALEVYEIRMPSGVKHNVARLKVTVKKTV